MAFASDLVALVHSIFVAFVIVGFALIVVGDLLCWRWTDNLYFRVAHFLSIGFLALRTWLAMPCPLTALETHLRTAPSAGTDTSELARFLHRYSFIGMSDRNFKIVVTDFAVIVLLEVLWAIIRKKRYDRRSR